jgi:transposase
MSAYQLIPLKRVQEYFRDRAQIELSTGTIHNMRKSCYEKLEQFETLARNNLSQANIVHFDETGVNVNGKNYWLHNASNDQWTLHIVHKRRGTEGIEALGVLPSFEGIACHDHWKPYFQYKHCLHVLCNAHHQRELDGAAENEQQAWATAMKQLLERINTAVNNANGNLPKAKQSAFRREYRKIIAQGLLECPQAIKEEGKRGKAKQTKSRNLLERLRDYEKETLRFITNPIVPYTNNQAERDVRMAKVHQKISGCFRSIEGAQIHCRIRSFISTAVKQGLTPSQALSQLFSNAPPEFRSS